MIPLRDDTPGGGTPWVTWALIAACAVGFAVAPDPTRAGWTPGRLWSAEAWGLLGLAQLAPLATFSFVHADWLHLLGNLWCLYLFGRAVEQRLGPGRYAALYALSSLGAAGAMLVARAGSLQPMVGASGPLAGILAAYVLLHPRARVTLLLPLPVLYTARIPAAMLIGAWALLQVLLASVSAGTAHIEGVAWWAHVGGLAAGALVLLAGRAASEPGTVSPR